MAALLKVFGRRAFVKLSMILAVARLLGLGGGSDSEGGGAGDYRGYGYDY